MYASKNLLDFHSVLPDLVSFLRFGILSLVVVSVQSEKAGDGVAFMMSRIM